MINKYERSKKFITRNPRLCLRLSIRCTFKFTKCIMPLEAASLNVTINSEKMLIISTASLFLLGSNETVDISSFSAFCRYVISVGISVGDTNSATLRY